MPTMAEKTSLLHKYYLAELKQYPRCLLLTWHMHPREKHGMGCRATLVSSCAPISKTSTRRIWERDSAVAVSMTITVDCESGALVVAGSVVVVIVVVIILRLIFVGNTNTVGSKPQTMCLLMPLHWHRPTIRQSIRGIARLHIITFHYMLLNNASQIKLICWCPSQVYLIASNALTLVCCVKVARCTHCILQQCGSLEVDRQTRQSRLARSLARSAAANLAPAQEENPAQDARGRRSGAGCGAGEGRAADPPEGERHKLPRATLNEVDGGHEN